MTGPEHYRKAEELAKTAARWPEASDTPALAALAQVHATLALAAASALPQTRTLSVAEYKSWAAVAAERAEAEGNND